MKKDTKNEGEMFNINNSPPGYLSVRDYLKKTAKNAPPDNEVNTQVHKD